MADLPRYRDLPATDLAGAPRHAWEVFPSGDQLGRLGLLTPERVLAAATEVRTGAVFNLCLPLDQPNPPWSPNRKPYTHHHYSLDRNSTDDYLDGFYLQASTQWDGFRHVRAAQLGFFGGLDRADNEFEGDELGIQAWAEKGIVSRGVLVDVGGYLETQGRELDPNTDIPIEVADLRATLDMQGVELREGDILMLRTGYIDAYLAADDAGRARFTESRDCPGLHAGEATAEFLWDSGVSAVITDNPAVEDVPGSKEAGSLHRRLLPLLGFALGEFFHFGPLAQACAADGRYTSLFVAAPLNLPGGHGSPGNAVAIR